MTGHGFLCCWGGQVVEEMEKWWRARRERWGFVMAEDG